jgi:hypothetical protein
VSRGFSEGGRPVDAQGYALGLQAAQQRLACPFRRSGVMLPGGQRQGLRHAARQAQAKFFGIPGDRCHFANSVCCGTSMPTTFPVFATSWPWRCSTDRTDLTDLTKW